MSTALQPALAAPFSDLDAGITGVPIPKGDPDAIARAATAWSHVGDQLIAQSHAVDGAAVAAVTYVWEGIASTSFESSSRRLSRELARGGADCHTARDACKAFAGILRAAQDDAREAARQAHRALDEIAQAKDAAAFALSEADLADHHAAEARAAGNAAKAQGPMGLAGAKVADQQEQQATDWGRAARGKVNAANGRLQHAEHDLRRAQGRGHDANERADAAGRHAAGVLHDVEHRAKGPARRVGALPQAVVHGTGGDATLIATLLGLLDPSMHNGVATVAGISANLVPGAVGTGIDGLGAGLSIAERRAIGWVDTLPLGPGLGGPHEAATRKVLRGVAKDARMRSMSTGGRALHGASKILNKLSPLYTYYENRKSGMSTTENVIRTGLSTAAADAAGGAGEALCGPLCGMAGAYGGAIAGDVAGQVVYKGVDAAYQHAITPLADDVGQLASDVAHDVTTLGGILG